MTKVKKILVANDTKEIYELISDYIEEQEVIWANDGEVAIEIYKKEKPDIVFMDILMPLLNGVEAIKRIKEFDKDAIIIVLSGIENEEVIKEAISAGAKKYIILPITKKELLSVIEDFFPL